MILNIDISWVLFIGTFGLTATQAIMLGIGAGGIGASLYGANRQAGAIEDANAANQRSQAEQNAAQWAAYLMTRGVNPTGARTGQIPANPQAINARLPLWANANFATGKSGWRKKGTGGGAINTLARAPMAAATMSGMGGTIFE